MIRRATRSGTRSRASSAHSPLTGQGLTRNEPQSGYARMIPCIGVRFRELPRRPPG